MDTQRGPDEVSNYEKQNDAYISMSGRSLICEIVATEMLQLHFGVKLAN